MNDQSAVKDVILAIEKLEKLKESQEKSETSEEENKQLTHSPSRKFSIKADDSKLPVDKCRNLKTKKFSSAKVEIQSIVCSKH